MNENYRVDIVGDLDYEDLIAEIYYKDAFVALLSQEHGYENLEIEIHPTPNRSCWSFMLTDFLEVLQHAKLRLWELRMIVD